VKVPLTTQDFLDRAETAYGDRVGAVDEPGVPGALGETTYRELAARVRGMAVRLDEMGVGVGDRVAFVAPNCTKFLIALLATTTTGRILVPVNFRLQPEEVAFIVDHSGADVLLVDPELDEQLAGVTAPTRIVLDGVQDADLFAPARDGAQPARWEPDEDAVATINYTSGTTSAPKGVMLTHRNLWINAVTFGWHMGLSDRDVYLHTLPQFHCNGWGVPLATVGMGIRNVIQRKVDGAQILDRVDEHGLTVMCGAPTVIAMIVEAGGQRAEAGARIPGAGTMRAFVAGSPPPSAVIERFEGVLDWEFNQLYGLTETSPLLTINRGREEWDDEPPAERSQLLSRAGAPSIGTRLTLAEDGEVLARSNTIFAGYWQRPDLTEQAHDDGWFRTGDGGEIEEGYLTITDRKKDVIISGGENVSSVEVEDRLYQHPAIADAAVIGVPHDRWGETVKAIVVLRDDAPETDEAALIAFCREHLAHYKCPTSVEIREELPRTATGKLQKYKLREPYWEGRRGVA